MPRRASALSFDEMDARTAAIVAGVIGYKYYLAALRTRRRSQNDRAATVGARDRIER
jgi:hypothetical protein